MQDLFCLTVNIQLQQLWLHISEVCLEHRATDEFIYHVYSRCSYLPITNHLYLCQSRQHNIKSISHITLATAHFPKALHFRFQCDL